MSAASRPVPITDESALTPIALSTVQAAALLSLSPDTLKKLRATGGGPRYARIGSRVVYLASDLTTWVAARRVR